MGLSIARKDLSPYHVARLAEGSGNATANTEHLQSLLDQAGNVFVPGPGTFYINDTLVIKSDTKLELANDVTIKQAPGTGKTMLVNAAYSNYTSNRISVSSLTYADGVVTASVASHSYSVGDYIAIVGATTPGFEGVWRVASTTATTITYYPNKEPAASAAGTIYVTEADKNIEITGGTWDYDKQNNGGGAGTVNALAMRFAYFDSMYVHDSSHLNGEKWNIAPFNCANSNFERLYIDGDSDGIHALGPMRNVHITNVRGQGGEDFVVMMCDESPNFSYTQVSEGDIDNCSIQNIEGDCTAGVAVLYSMSDFGFNDMVIRNVTGSGTSVIKLWGDTNNFTSGQNKSVYIYNVSGSDYSASRELISVIHFACQNLVIDGITRTGEGTDRSGVGQNMVYIQGTTTHIQKFTLRNVIVSHWNVATAVLATNNNVVIDYCHLDGWSIVGGGVLRPVYVLFAGIKHLNITNSYFEDCAHVVLAASSAAVQVLTADSVKFQTCVSCFRFDVNVPDINITNFESDSCTNVMYFNHASSFNVRGCSWQHSGFTTLWNVAAGDVALFAPDLQADVSDFDNTVAGQIFYNTNGTAGGTLTTGLVVSHGGDWFNVHDPSLTWSP